MLGERIQYDLRKMMFNHLQDLSLSYYAQNAVGRLIARVTSDTSRVADLMTWGVVDTTWAIMNIGTSLVFMTIINWRLALIVAAVFPVMIIIGVQLRRKILVEFRDSRRANSKITGAYNESIQGVRVVKALGREAENLREFQVLTGRHVQGLLPGCLALGPVPAGGADRGCAGPGRHRLVRRSPKRSRPDHHRRHQCFRLLPHLHDVARAGPGAESTRRCSIRSLRRSASSS